MSTSLFDLVGEYLAAAEKLSELDLPPEVVSDTLEGISGDIETKVTNIAHVALNFEATAAAIKEHAGKQLLRAKAIESRADALRDYIARSMQATGIQKIEGPGVKLNFRKSQSVVIDGEDMIPNEYMRLPVTPPPAPDKTAIARALKAGESVPGAHLQTNQNLQIS